MIAILASLATAAVAGSVAYWALTRPRSRKNQQQRVATVAGLDVTPGQFWSAVLGVSGVTFLVVYTITGLMVVSLVPTAVVATLPRAYFSRKTCTASRQSSGGLARRSS